MIKFIHVADTHFGIENYGRIDSQTGIHSRLLDFQKAFNFCIDTAIDKDVDFFLFCGDAYKTIHPTPTQQKLFIQCLLRLYKANIPVVIIVGNHDNPLSFGKATSLDIFSDLPLDGFYVISKPQILPIKSKNGLINIVAVPWPTRSTLALSEEYQTKASDEITTYISQSVGNIISHFSKKLDRKIPAILAGHLTVSSGIFSGSEKRAIYGNDPVILPSQLAVEPFDYVALGHLHRHQNLNEKNSTPIVYSGSIERIDFGERNEEKGFCFVQISDQKETQYEFIKTPIRPFCQIEAQLNTDTDQTEFLLNEIQKHKIQNAIVKIVYHLPENQKDSVDIEKIQLSCQKAHHLASIIPIRKVDTRPCRVLQSSSCSLENLLDTFFATKTQFKDHKENLIKKAIALHEESKNTETL